MVIKREPDSIYDVFLSYSSVDTDQADRVQRFLERYKHPKGTFGPSELRITVFRDKTDQGLTPDFREVFEKQITVSPSFLLLGSEASCASPHVIKECECFLKTGRDSINLALVGESIQRAFPSIVLERFPRAIYADLRMIRGSKTIRWWLNDRRRFHEEMLRIVSSILQRKAGIPLSYETLQRRERRRRVRRMIFSCLTTVVFLVTLVAYYATTDKYGVHYTELGQAQVEQLLSNTEANGEVVLFAATERKMFWSDEAGHEGTDVSTVIHGLDSSGRLKGSLEFTYQDEWDTITEPEPSGVFRSMTSNKISQLLFRMGYQGTDQTGESPDSPTDQSFSWKTDCEVHQANVALTHQFDARRAFQVCGNDHTPPSLAYYTEDAGKTWSRAVEFAFHLKNASVWYVGGPVGMAFVGTPEEVDPYYRSHGGLFVTTDFGKMWAPVPTVGDDWNSLERVAGNPRNPHYIAVALGAPKRSGDLEFAGLWFTRNGGISWEPAGFQGANINVTALYVTDQHDAMAVVNGQLVIYRKRSIIDRLLQRRDLPSSGGL